MAKLGPTFGDELWAAGVGGLPFSWGDDGEFFGRENLTAEQNKKIDAVVAAHDPSKKPPPLIDVDAIETIEDVKAALRILTRPVR